MVIHRQSDSLTKCPDELYNNMFTLEKRPSAHHSTHAVHPKDTIERCLNKEALDRLQRPSQDTIAQPSYLFRRIGKYVFLTVALPPYFLAYGLPKWILVEALPTLFSALTMVAKKFQDKLQKPLARIIETLNQMLFYVKMLSQRIITPVAKFGIEVRQFFQRLSERGQEFFENLGKALKEGVNKPLTVISELMERSKESWNATVRWISEKVQIAQQSVKESFNWMISSPALLFNWGAAQMQKINEGRQQWRVSMNMKLQSSKNMAQACTQWVNQQFSSVKGLALAAFLPLVKLHQGTIKPLFNFVSESLKNVKNAMSGFLGNRKKRTLEFLSRAQGRMKELTPNQALERIFSNNFLTKLPVLLRNILLALKQNAFFQACFGAGFRGFQFFFLQVARLVTAGIMGISQVAHKVSEGYAALVQQVKKLLLKAKDTVIGSLNFCKKVWDRGFYGGVVLAIMGGYLMLWGMEWLGEITAQWMAKLSFQKKNTR